MATDMDIDMDLDVEGGFLMPSVEALPQTTHIQTKHSNGTESHHLSDSEATRSAPNKVHLRGLDNLTTSDIKGFASEYFHSELCERVEWIDDTSANLVYSTSEVALQALMALTTQTINLPGVPILEMLPAKPFPGHPDVRLEVRLAVVGDRKQVGARERSRFYLFNPQYDPSEQRKRDGSGRRGRRTYRERDDGGYRNQIYDDHEQHRRQRVEAFDASLYDDNAEALAARKPQQGNPNRRDSRSSISSGESRDRSARRVRSSGTRKELFPGRVAKSISGRLRDRSASPVRSIDGDEKMLDLSRSERYIRSENSSSANRLKAQIIKSALRDTDEVPKELFPQKTAISHRRSAAFDAADATADLFADKMSVPFVDGSSDARSNGPDILSGVGQKDRPLADRISSSSMRDQSTFNIRGAAQQQQPMGFTIRGTAMTPANAVKELFPSQKFGNSGKELFSEKLEGRGIRRQKAEDMFH